MNVCVCVYAPMCVCVWQVSEFRYIINDDEGGWIVFFVPLCIVFINIIHLSLNFLDEQCIIYMYNFASHIDILLLATSVSLGVTRGCDLLMYSDWTFKNKFKKKTFSWLAYHMVMWVFWIDVIIITCAVHTIGYIWW